MTVNVNLSGVGDTTSLVNAINAGIQGAAGQGTAAAGALKAANVVAEIHTGADGHQQLLFSSSSASVGVAAGDIVANAFLGNSGTNVAGAALNASATGEALATSNSSMVAGGTAQLAVNYTTGLLKATPETQALTFTSYDASGSPFSTQVKLDSSTAAGANQTAAEAAAQINTQLQATDVSSLQKIVATVNAAGTGIVFSSTASRFDMTIGVNTGVAGDGIKATSGTAQGVIAQGKITGTGGNADISNQASAAAAVSALACCRLHARHGTSERRQIRERVQLRDESGAVAVHQPRGGRIADPRCGSGQRGRQPDQSANPDPGRHCRPRPGQLGSPGYLVPAEIVSQSASST